MKVDPTIYCPQGKKRERARNIYMYIYICTNLESKAENQSSKQTDASNKLE